VCLLLVVPERRRNVLNAAPPLFASLPFRDGDGSGGSGQGSGWRASSRHRDGGLSWLAKTMEDPSRHVQDRAAAGGCGNRRQLVLRLSGRAPVRLPEPSDRKRKLRPLLRNPWLDGDGLLSPAAADQLDSAQLNRSLCGRNR